MDQMMLKVSTKEKKETVEHYRSLLRLANEHRLSETEWNQASSKIELLDDIIKSEGKFDFIAELEKLTAEHIEEEGMLADVNFKVPDWCKLGKKWMLDE
ncbi:hypothetical protein Bca4012_063565 [Brassica carinata]